MIFKILIFFFQKLSSPSHKEIVLPSDLQTKCNLGFKAKTEDWGANFVVENTTIALTQKNSETTIPHDAFVDLVADYMEDLLDSKSVACLSYEDQVHQQWPLYVTILTMEPHNQTMFLNSSTISQTVCFFYKC